MVALPLLAVVRGVVLALMGQADTGGIAGVVGQVLASLGLVFGAVFFGFSVRYYLATITVLATTSLTGGRQNGNGHGNGNGLNRIAHHSRNGNGDATPPQDLGHEPFISVHIATYNEKRVLERLLQCCADFEYGSYEVVLVDDSTDESLEILERWRGRPGFKIVHRDRRRGFKGGALAEALEHMDPRAEYVVVFDADAMPFPDTLQRFLPHFYQGTGRSPRPRRDVAAVQSYQWHVLNKSESWLTAAVRAEYAGSYMVERVYQDDIGAMKMVAGTAYMIRADLLRELGWGRSLTEDWQLTLRLYRRGWRVLYTPYAEAPAECVSTFGRLARQRMRWAEGHCHNVRRYFLLVLASRRMSLPEKLEFLYYATYYLQALYFMVGTLCWLGAEIVFHSRVPEWSAVLGWSMVLTNMLALPLMNVSGLVLEEAPRRDLWGALGALALSYLLAPFQAYASVKGFLEPIEGPWFRTPKTGAITDPVHHLRKLRALRRLMFPRRGGGDGGHRIEARPRPRRPARRLGWVVVVGMSLATAGLGLQAAHAPVAEAAGTDFYLHGASSFTLDQTSPSGAQQSFVENSGGDVRIWGETAPTNASQTIAQSDVFSFHYWTSGTGGASATNNLTFGYDSASSCGAISRVQGAANVTTSSFTTTVTLGAVSAGDLLVGQVHGTGTDTNMSISDPVNGTWTTIPTSSGNQMAYVQNAKAAASLTVTGTGSVSGNIRLAVDEFSGVATASALDTSDQYSASGGSFTATATSAVGAGELLYTTFVWSGNTSFTPGTSNGAQLTAGAQDLPAAGGSIATEYTTYTIAGPQNSSGTYSSTGSGGGNQAVFKPANPVTTIATTSATLAGGSNLTTAGFSPASAVTVPAGSFFCWTTLTTAVSSGGVTLLTDASASPTRLNSANVITIPELARVAPLLGLALAAPLLGRRLRRRREPRPGRAR